MQIQSSTAAQDYVKTIYKLSKRYGRATTSKIAEQLQITPASVTGMLRKMANSTPPLITYHKHQGATLTHQGEEVALEVLRHHRLIEMFLHKKLGYRWDEVHEEADRLEHAISEEMEGRIAAVLGHPRRNPHGQPIPDRHLQMMPTTAVALTTLTPHQQATIWSVPDEDSALLRRYAALGLRPGCPLTLLTTNEQTVTLSLDNQEEPIPIQRCNAEQIFVEID